MLITPLEILHSGDLYVKIILNGKYLAKVLEVFLSFSSSFFRDFSFRLWRLAPTQLFLFRLLFILFIWNSPKKTSIFLKINLNSFIYTNCKKYVEYFNLLYRSTRYKFGSNASNTATSQAALCSKPPLPVYPSCSVKQPRVLILETSWLRLRGSALSPGHGRYHQHASTVKCCVWTYVTIKSKSFLVLFGFLKSSNSTEGLETSSVSNIQNFVYCLLALLSSPVEAT